MKRLVRAAVTVAVASAVTASAGVQSGSMSPALRALAASASKEGELLVTWSATTMGGATGAKAFETAMNRAYGTSIRIKWAPGPSMSNVGNQIALRFQSRLPSPTDVYLASSRDMAELLKYDLFRSAPYTEYDTQRLSSEIVERGTYVKVFSGTLGWTYNSKLAPSIPRRLEDFLRPEWKGKIATTAYAAGFEQIAASEGWGSKRTIEFGKKFSDQVAGFIRCNDIDRLITGEFVALVLDCAGDATRRAISKGAPLVRVIAPDVPLINYYYFAVPKNAQHPHAGILFSAFASSKEGQQIIHAQNGSDLHLYPESAIRRMVNEVETKYKFKFKYADIAWQLGNTEGNFAQQQIEKMLQRK